MGIKQNTSIITLLQKPTCGNIRIVILSKHHKVILITKYISTTTTNKDPHQLSPPSKRLRHRKNSGVLSQELFINPVHETYFFTIFKHFFFFATAATTTFILIFFNIYFISMRWLFRHDFRIMSCLFLSVC